MSLFCRLSLLPPRRAPGASSVRGAHLIAMAVASSSGSSCLHCTDCQNDRRASSVWRAGSFGADFLPSATFAPCPKTAHGVAFSTC
jgi:hypothetical protein